MLDILPKMRSSNLELLVLYLIVMTMNPSLISSSYSSILSNSTDKESIHECSIALYIQENLMGGSVIISNNGANIDIQEHSAETTGSCCWRVYR